MQESIAPRREASRLTMRSKLLFSCGNFAVLISKLSPKQLAMPVYHDALGINPWILSTFLGVARLVDAFTDMIVGHWSDNTSTRWGRRRPFIFVGAMLNAVFFASMWLFPTGMSEGAYLVYFAIMASLFYLSLSFYSVPWYALGYELPPNYDDRTRLQSWVNVFGLLGQISLGWFYPITQLKIFGNMINGIRFMGIMAGGILLVIGIIPALFLREPDRDISPRFPRIAKKTRPTFREGLRATWKCNPFVRLTLSYSVVLIAASLSKSLNYYIHTYLLFGGNRGPASILTGWNLTILCVSSILFTPLASKLSIRFDKKSIFILALCWGALRSLLLWFLLDPVHPCLVLINSVLNGFDEAAIFMLCHAMISDICDKDELSSGTRREGLFGGVYGWVFKSGNVLSLMVLGYILLKSGFRGGTVTATYHQSALSLLWLKVSYCVIPASLYFLGAILMWRYPINRELAESIRAALQSKRLSGNPHAEATG
jgi:glycoside/pentoside/hexuronide:cation symporter, GPH family